MPACSSTKPARIRLTKSWAGSARIQASGIDDVAQLHGISARTVEREKFRIGGEAYALGGARHDRHDR